MSSAFDDPISIVKKIQKHVLEARGYVGRSAGWLFVFPEGVDYSECVEKALEEEKKAEYELLPDINAVLIHDPWLDRLEAVADFEACLRSSCIPFKKFRVVKW